MNLNQMARRYTEYEQGIMEQLQDWISAIDGYIYQHELWNEVHADVWSTPSWRIEDSDKLEVYLHSEGVRYELTLNDPYEDWDQHESIYIPDAWNTMTTAEIVESIVSDSKRKYELEYQSMIRDAERMAKELGMKLVEDEEHEQ